MGREKQVVRREAPTDRESVSASRTLIAFDNIFGFPGHPADGRGRVVRRDELRSFISELIAPHRPQPWCDLVMVPSTLPDAGLLVERIVGG